MKGALWKVCSADQAEGESLMYSTIFKYTRDKYQKLLGKAEIVDKHLKERLITMTDTVVSIVRQNASIEEDDRELIIKMKRADNVLPQTRGSTIAHKEKERERGGGKGNVLNEIQWKFNGAERRKIIFWNTSAGSVGEFEQALQEDIGIGLQGVVYMKCIHSHPARSPWFELGFRQRDSLDASWHPFATVHRHLGGQCIWAVLFTRGLLIVIDKPGKKARLQV